MDQNAEAKSLKDFIFKVPTRFVLTMQSIRLQLPCPERATRNFSASKLINVLTHFGRSRIFGGADMPVVAAVVFNGEVTVNAQSCIEQRNFSGYFLKFVAKFVTDIQTES